MGAVCPCGSVIAIATILIAALLSSEMADMASRQQVADRHPQQQSGHVPRNKIGPPKSRSRPIGSTDTGSGSIFCSRGSLLYSLALCGARLNASAYFAETQAIDMQNLLRAARDNTTAAASQAEAMKQLHAVSEAQERVMQRHADAALAQVRIMIARKSPHPPIEKLEIENSRI